MSSKIIRDRATMSMVSSSYLPKKRVQRDLMIPERMEKLNSSKNLGTVL